MTVVGDYSLEITLSSCSNPEERDASGNCCFDNGTVPLPQDVCPGTCNTTLFICAQDIEAPPNTCSIGMGTIPQMISSLTIFSQGAWPVRTIIYDVEAAIYHYSALFIQYNNASIIIMFQSCMHGQ